MDPYDKLRDTYRNVKLYTPPEIMTHFNTDNPFKNTDADDDNEFKTVTLDHNVKYDERFEGKFFKPSVSFNTVPKFVGYSCLNDEGVEFEGVQIPYSMDDFYDTEVDHSNPIQELKDSSYFNIPNKADHSRRSSPPPRLTAKDANTLASMFKIAQNGKIVRVDYPSRPSVANDSIIINNTTTGWLQKWESRKKQMDERCNEQDKYFSKPKFFFPPPEKVKTTLDGYTLVPKKQVKRELILKRKVGFPNTPRTIVVHISGRRHTWVALDWTLRKLIHDTDHLVVITNLPKYHSGTDISATSAIRRKHSRQNSDGSSSNRPLGLMRTKSAEVYSHSVLPPLSPVTNNSPTKDNNNNSTNNNKHNSYTEWCAGYSKELIEEKLNNIFHYISVILPKDKTIKITIEFVVENTRKAVIDATNIYTPDLFISSTLRWNRTSDLVRYKSKNLTDKLCTFFPTPTIIIPAKRMFEFEARLENEFQKPSKIIKNYSNKPNFHHSNTTSILPDNSISPATSVNRLNESENDLNTDNCDEDDDEIDADEEDLAQQLKEKATITDDNDDNKDKDSINETENSESRESTAGPCPCPGKYNEFVAMGAHLTKPNLKKRIHEFTKNHRNIVRENMDNIENDNNLSNSLKNVKKIDYLLKASYKFVNDIEQIDSKEASDEYDFAEFKKILTGQQARKSMAPRKSMLDVLGDYQSLAEETQKIRDKKKKAKAAKATKSKQSSQILQPNIGPVPKNLPRAPKNMKIPKASQSSPSHLPHIHIGEHHHANSADELGRSHQHYTLANRKSVSSSADTSKSSQIKFANTVKHTDGKNALGNSGRSKSVSPDRSGRFGTGWSDLKLTISNSSRHSNDDDKISIGSDKIKRMTSRESLKRHKSNDSSSSDKKNSSSGGGGWFSFFSRH